MSLDILALFAMLERNRNYNSFAVNSTDAASWWNVSKEDRNLFSPTSGLFV